MDDYEVLPADGSSPAGHDSDDDRLGLTKFDPLTDEHEEFEGRRLQASLRAKLFGAPFEPHKLDRWTLLERVGSGAMGVVYAAYDPKLDRRVAIKMLKQTRGNDPRVARRRLLREARAMARISHPHVVHVYEVPTVGDRICVVMEYVQGSTLRAWQQKIRPLPDIIEKYVQGGRGLACIHQKGLVHRDFKPENVFVDESGRVVVGDLGLVHVAGPSQQQAGDSRPSVRDVQHKDENTEPGDAPRPCHSRSRKKAR